MFKLLLDYLRHDAGRNRVAGQVPPWIDVAIFERPGHGQRSSQPLAKMLVDEAKDTPAFSNPDA